MSRLLQLFWEFFKTGLFSIGGGMATFPFLKSMGEATGWFSYAELVDMVAVSESTPGPIGINMASYVGFTVAGIPGAVVATLGEVIPSITIILLIAAFLRRFRESRLVNDALYGLRPASAGLITEAGITIIIAVLLTKDGSFGLDFRGLLLGAALFVLTNYVKPTKKLHPIIFIAASALIGIIFQW